jgi:circadian clock protein KaiC
VIGVTGYAKQEEITGFSPTQQINLCSLIRSQILIFPQLPTQFDVAIRRNCGEMSRAINVFKMRGSWHDKGIREYVINWSFE